MQLTRTEKRNQSSPDWREKEAAEPVMPPELSSPVMAAKSGKAAEEMLFEPLFVTDYFASRGSKLQRRGATYR